MHRLVAVGSAAVVRTAKALADCCFPGTVVEQLLVVATGAVAGDHKVYTVKVQLVPKSRAAVAVAVAEEEATASVVRYHPQGWKVEPRWLVVAAAELTAEERNSAGVVALVLVVAVAAAVMVDTQTGCALLAAVLLLVPQGMIDQKGQA